MFWLNELDRNAIEFKAFPLMDILQNSLYYPASGVDGSPIRHWELGVNSFVYADISISEEVLMDELAVRPIYGYEILGQRNVMEKELNPNRWRLQIPISIDPGFKERYLSSIKMAEATHQNAFAKWIVFQRKDDFDENHGPWRFSVLHIRGEGAATYQGLYVANRELPKIFAMIRPGVGFGGNYGDFCEILLSTMLMHPDGLPKQLLAWHPIGSQEGPLLSIGDHWRGYYDALPILRPLSKDGEANVRISVYPLRSISSGK